MPISMASDTESQLLQLCTDGNLPALKDLITKQALNPNEMKDPSGPTLLHLACQHGHLDIVQYLINDQDCNPESTTLNGRTSLHTACKSGHLHIVKCLITDHKCNPHCTDNDGYTPLHAASESGNIETVKYLITEQGCDPHVVDSIGNTPLHYASESGHLHIVQELITNFNCDPQKANNRGSIPLHYACRGGQIAVARYLIDEHQCNPNCTIMSGNTSLHLACLNGHLAVAVYLIDELGCNPHNVNNYGRGPLHFACLSGHFDIAKYLISDCKCDSQGSENTGKIPLHYACANGHLEVAKYLTTEHKCSPEHGNLDGYTPLHSAASNGHLAVVKYLISELSCTPLKTTKSGHSPLHYACRKGHLDITKYLISECNCNPHCFANNGNSPLHCACKNGHLEVAKYLITEHKCSPEHGNINGCTPLHSAASNGHLAVVKYFISELGCNKQIADSNGVTPLNLACLKGHLDIAKYFVSDCNCNPQCPDKNGNTPLHSAWEGGHLEVAKYLITEHNCSPEHGNVNGYTPLHSAASKGHLTVVKYLITQHNCNPQCCDTNGYTPLHAACHCGHLHIAKYLIHEQHCACDPECRFISINDYRVEAMLKKLGIQKQLLSTIYLLPPDEGLTPLHFACIIGHLDIVKYLINVCRCDPKHPTSNGYTAVDFAQMGGCQEVFSYLRNEYQCSSDVIQKTNRLIGLNSSHSLSQTNFNVTDMMHSLRNMCNSPLYKACSTGNLAAVKALTTKPDCNPYSGGLLGFTPLTTACMNGHLEVAKYLVRECKYDPNCSLLFPTSPLCMAILCGQLHVVKWLVSELKYNSVYNQMCYSLFACASGQLSVLKCLLSEQSSEDFPFLLLVACSFGHFHIVKYLIEQCKCDPCSIFYDDTTPLHHACGDIKHFLGENCQNTFEATRTDNNQGTFWHIWKVWKVWKVIYQILTTIANVFPGYHAQKMDDYDFLSDANCESKSTEQQPMNGHLDIVKYLVFEHNCKPQCRDKEGQTPLHYACASGYLEIVQYFHSEKFSDLVHTAHSGDTPLHYACKYNQVKVVQFLLSTGECDPLIKNKEGFTSLEITSSPEIRKLLDFFHKGKYPLESVVKVFVLGDPMAGKSSLMQAIQSNPGFLSSLIGRFQKVKGVRQQTVGIDSFNFSSSDFGNVVIYDFAGQREFHTSHAAFLQNYLTYMKGIFVVVTNIALCEDDICQSLQYWMSFIQECCTHNQVKSPVIIVGSHADLLDNIDVDKAFTTIQQAVFFEDTDLFYELEGIVCLDCTRSTSHLDLLRSYLEQSCDSVRDSTETIDQRCYILHRYMWKKNTTSSTQEQTLRNISKDLENNKYLLPTDPTELMRLFQTLHDKGQLIFLQNDGKSQDSWVITNISTLFETVVGSIFAPRKFPQHISPGSTGIVPKSRMINHFPRLNIDMVIGFLEHFEFCHRVESEWISDSQSNQVLSDDEYYLFPALVTSENTCQESEGFYYCRWYMHCTADHHFFTARFLQVLLLRLAFRFSLSQDDAIPSSRKNKAPALSRRCNMWKNGISWSDANGVTAVFEVNDLKTTTLNMTCKAGGEIHCVRMRTKLIKAILKAKDDFCPLVHVEECLMELANSHDGGDLQFIAEFSHSIKDLSRAIADRNSNDCPDLTLIHHDGSTGKQVSEVLYFEPYAVLTPDLIKMLFEKENAKKLLSSSFITELASRMYPFNNSLEEILKPDPSVVSEKCKQIHSDSLGEIYRQQLRCKYILETWMEQQQPAATYKMLQEELNEYSIFCGRNPLKLVCKNRYLSE